MSPPRASAAGRRAALAVAVVFAAAASGYFAARLAGHRGSYPMQESATAVPGGPVGQAPATQPAQGQDRSPQHPVPESLPDVSLPDGNGIRHKLSDWKGRPLLINFWATWCEPCRREIPLLKSLRHERSGDGLEVIGIAVDFRDAVQRYARAMAIDYPILIGEDDGMAAISAFGMDTVFPFTVFADRQGRIVTLKVGELHREEAKFILDRVREVDKGTLTLADARRDIADGTARLAAERAQAEVASGHGAPQQR